MTRIRPESPTVRETAVFERTDPIIVSLHPKHLEIRLKGSAEAYAVDYAKLLSYTRGLQSIVRYGVRKKAAG